MTSRLSGCGLAGILALIGCDAPTSNQSSHRAANATVPDMAVASKASFEARGERWPLTVSSGTLGCTGDARWIEVDGVRYGLNGFATAARGYRDIESIWAFDEEMARQMTEAGAGEAPATRINIGELIQAAGRLC
jgi:hypothetical protein